MISCQLKPCGLGSQLFQIATTLALAWDNDDEAVFDFSTQLQPSQGRKASEYLDSIYSKLTIEQNPRVDYCFKESGQQYTPIPYRPYMQLDGFFFSEKYFAHHRDRLLDLFAPTDAILSRLIIDVISQMPRPTQETNTCAIHVRHGDYANYSQYHHQLDTEYYLTAINMFPPLTKFLVFSDDIDWCKRHFVGDRYFLISGDSDIHQLYLMSVCQYQIIANSTFSWWGAWLNNNKDKVVIVPKQWFGKAVSSSSAEDVYTDEMIRI